MRNPHFDAGRFSAEVRRRGKKARENFLTDAALVNPTLESSFENRLGLKVRDADSLVLLSIMSWYLDPGIGVLLRLEILEKIENNRDLVWIKLLLDSEPRAILFLQETQLWDTNQFFGNLFTDKMMKKVSRSLYLKFKSKRRPRRKVRRRGYQDKGTWRAPHEHHSFYDGTKEQIVLEQERRSYKDSLLFLRGFLE